MDLSVVEHLIPNIASALNVEPSTVLFGLIAFSAFSNLLARWIPDDSTGKMHAARLFFKFFGLYAQNRISKNVGAYDAIRSVVKKTEEKES